MDSTTRPMFRPTRCTIAAVWRLLVTGVPAPGLLVTGLLTTGLLSAGCATIAHGRSQDVVVRSEPPGAAIFVNGRAVGATPAPVRMPRRGIVILVVEKAGYVPARLPVSRRRSRWLFGNAVFLNPLAAQGMDSMSQWAAAAAAWFVGVMAIDVVSGGAFTRPPAVTVTLEPLIPAGGARPVNAAACARTPPGCWPPGVRPDCPATC